MTLLDRPALIPLRFGDEDVRATMAGRKTMTRWPIEPPLDIDCSLFGYNGSAQCYEFIRADHGGPFYDFCLPIKPPVLWNETMYVSERWAISGAPRPDGSSYIYHSDAPDAQGVTWQSPNDMPIGAARIFLRVRDVYPERLRDINIDDLRAEGYEIHGADAVTEVIDRYRAAWDERIDPKVRHRYGWYANPWVWVIEFERCEGPAWWVDWWRRRDAGC